MGLCAHEYRRLYPDDRTLVMEIQSLVRSGKMQRIKSTLHAAKPAPAPPARPLDRKISINLGGHLA